ncbi:hypothetical protein [Actinoplanes sp. NPDC051851]|uniref:hypothetical protein n=1 Tax=Actinoplanes sp. NPDC051851 TaxID=3154753 RepID=UPI003430C096
MQPDSPYQVTKPLGSSQLGTVWAAVDGEGRELTVAVLEAGVASEQRWRDAFTSAANTLPQQKDGQRYVSADFSAAAPWVILASDGGPGAEQIFLALGADYQPIASGAPTPPPAPAPISMPTTTTSTTQAAPIATADPVETAPAPAPAPTPTPQWDSAPAPAPQWENTPAPSPQWENPPAPAPAWEKPAEKKRGLRTWGMVGILSVIALTGAGTLFALTQGDDRPAGGDPAVAASEAAVPTPTPLHPGIEPPRIGDWPVSWPQFTAKDKAQTLALDGVDLQLPFPRGWACAPAATSEGATKFTCGMTSGGEQIGGEIIVRDCAQPCDTAQQDSLRTVEEAWGQQWRYAGTNVTLAETLKVDGADRYGMVVIAYYKTTAQDPVNRQLVIRMTAPLGWRDDVRRVANGARAAAQF